jgi:hypothetical protein
MSYPQQPGGGWQQDQSWPADPYNQPASGQPASPAGYGDYGYQQAAYSAQPAAYPAYGYGTPAVVMPVPAAPSTNGMAIASLVCSLAGLATCGVTAIIGAILGHVARRQIRERGEGGDGLALAGIISGWIIFALYALGIAAYIVFAIILVSAAATNPGFDPTYYPTTYPS